MQFGMYDNFPFIIEIDFDEINEIEKISRQQFSLNIKHPLMCQVSNHIVSSKLVESFQLSFKTGHSTQTALVNFSKSLRCTFAQNQASILILTN